LSDVWFRYDPLDLAITRSDSEALYCLRSALTERLGKPPAMPKEARQIDARGTLHAGLAKQWALRQSEYRLEAEIAYLTDLLEMVDGIVACERRALVEKS